MTNRSETFEGKFLTPHFTWVLGGTPPDAGYSMDAGYRLYRNGEHVGTVRLQERDSKPGGWWIHYTSWRGSPLDMSGRA